MVDDCNIAVFSGHSRAVADIKSTAFEIAYMRPAQTQTR